ATQGEYPMKFFFLLLSLVSCMANQSGPSPSGGSGGSNQSSSNAEPVKPVPTPAEEEESNETEESSHSVYDLESASPDTLTGIEITCSSQDKQITECPLNLENAEAVHLEEQLSDDPCVEGQTYGHDEK